MINNVSKFSSENLTNQQKEATMTLSPLKKLIEESNSSPVKEHTKVISNFLETYKHRVLEE